MVMLFGKDSNPSPFYTFFGEVIAFTVFVFVFGASNAVQFILPASDNVLVGLAHGIGLMMAMMLTIYLAGGQINPLTTIVLYINSWIYTIFPLQRKNEKPDWNRFDKFTLLHVFLLLVGGALGALFGALLLLALFGGHPDKFVAILGRPMVGPGSSQSMAFAYEIIGSSIFFTVVLVAFSSGRVSEFPFGPTVPIGITYLALSLVGIPLSGAAFNWWLHLFPTLIGGGWSTVDDEFDGVVGTNADWIWYVGPLIGIAIAFVIYWFIYFGYITLVRPSGTREAAQKVNKKRKSTSTRVEQSPEELFEAI